MRENILQVTNLTKYFPVTAGIFRRLVGNVKAVDGVDFQVAAKEVVGIVGESGSGKSTLGRVAIRLLEPTSGEIRFLGEDFLALDQEQLKRRRRDVQMIFQDPYASLNPRKTVLESIGESLLYHGVVKNKKEQAEVVAPLLLQVGLPIDAMFRYPHQFSGGQQQRICIGRAIALKPKLIVCDEALSALDVSIQAQIMNLLIELQQTYGLSFLFISHDLSVVRYISDHVIVLYLGKVMESAPAQDLFSSPKHPYTQALLSSIPKRHPSEKSSRVLLKGEIPSARHPPSGCPFRTRCPYAQPICSLPPPKKIVHPDHVYHCILD